MRAARNVRPMSPTPAAAYRIFFSDKLWSVASACRENSTKPFCKGGGKKKQKKNLFTFLSFYHLARLVALFPLVTPNTVVSNSNGQLVKTRFV